MAILKAPLLSLDARGQLGKALVFIGWKGIKDVREYVVPSNPDSTLQHAQRQKMTDAVAEWHAAPYTAADKTAWNLLALIHDKILSGFNMMCMTYIKEKILGNVWTRITGGQVVNPTPTSLMVICTKVSGGLAPYVWYGTSKTFLPNSIVMVDLTGNEWRVTIPGLVTKTKYYLTIKVGVSAATYGRLGLYEQSTT